MTAADIARELGADDRTIRRALADGTIRARRRTERTVELSSLERDYLVGHWSTLHALRRALRTEPNVAAAVLFGSVARGDDAPSSDIDLFVQLKKDSPIQASSLENRLSEALGRHVQITRATKAEKAPQLVLDVLAEGRPLVDRCRYWPHLQRSKGRFRKAAAAASARTNAALESEYGIELPSRQHSGVS